MKLAYRITKTFFIVLFTASLHIVSLAQQGWNVLVPFPTNKALSAVSFINETTGWLVGDGD
jgi:hypothetical protein